jgi:hypothetical protein
MPVLMSKGEQIGIKRVQENMPELQRMIKDESERIEQREKQQGKGKQKQTQ